MTEQPPHGDWRHNYEEFLHNPDGLELSARISADDFLVIMRKHIYNIGSSIIARGYTLPDSLIAATEYSDEDIKDIYESICADTGMETITWSEMRTILDSWEAFQYDKSVPYLSTSTNEPGSRSPSA